LDASRLILSPPLLRLAAERLPGSEQAFDRGAYLALDYLRPQHAFRRKVVKIRVLLHFRQRVLFKDKWPLRNFSVATGSRSAE
jgi:hypothetical protein